MRSFGEDVHCEFNYTHDNFLRVKYMPDRLPTVTDDMLQDPRITAIGLFSEAYAGLMAQLTAQLATHQLDGIEFETLIRLARSPGGALRMSDLASQTGLSTSGVTRVVDRLEHDELVERKACPTDRRGSFTEITAAGRARLGDVLPEHLRLLDTWFTGLMTERQLHEFLGALRLVRDAVRPGAVSGA